MKWSDLYIPCSETRRASRSWIYHVTHYSILDDVVDAAAFLTMFVPKVAVWLLAFSSLASLVSFLVAMEPEPRRLMVWRSVAYGMVSASLITGIQGLGIAVCAFGVVGLIACVARRWYKVAGGRIIMAALVFPSFIWCILWVRLFGAVG